MKKITAYVNTLRIHWLVEKLQEIGIEEIVVTEHFKPLSQISRMILQCKDDEVDGVREIIHRYGSTGKLPDHAIHVDHVKSRQPSQFLLGRRLSYLEELRIKSLVRGLLDRVGLKLSLAFLVITATVVLGGIVTYSQLKSLQDTIEQSAKTVLRTLDATDNVQTAILEQVQAAEETHNADIPSALRRFREASAQISLAIDELRHSDFRSDSILDSLSRLDQQFQSNVSAMAETLRGEGDPRSHQRLMITLGRTQRELMRVLLSLERAVKASVQRTQEKNDELLHEIRLSLLVLALGGIAAIGATWLVAERKVTRPLRLLIKEAENTENEEML